MTDRDGNGWSFLTSHTQVLLYLIRDPDVPPDELAERVGIDDVAARRVLSDLIEAGYVEVDRVDHHDRYTVNQEAHMRHVFQQEREIGDLLALLQLEPMSEGRDHRRQSAGHRGPPVDSTPVQRPSANR